MRPSIFPSDESLPTWLHTTLCVAATLPFVGYLWWYAGLALLTGRLEPLSGPEFGQYFFGNTTLTGRGAHVAAISLLLLGASFVAMGLSYSRHAEDRQWLRVLPWVLLPLGLAWPANLLHPG